MRKKVVETKGAMAILMAHWPSGTTQWRYSSQLLRVRRVNLPESKIRQFFGVAIGTTAEFVVGRLGGKMHSLCAIASHPFSLSASSPRTQTTGEQVIWEWCTLLATLSHSLSSISTRVSVCAERKSSFTAAYCLPTKASNNDGFVHFFSLCFKCLSFPCAKLLLFTFMLMNSPTLHIR